MRQAGLPLVSIFSTAGSIQDVFAFYQEKLFALGWEAGEPVVENSMGVAVFQQTDQPLTVIMKPSENGVKVRLLIGPTPS